MYKLEIKLKQHTPLIHFQHDQEGATLRASEVKPKLDKFILSKLSPDEKNQGEQDGWIKSKKEKTWLDYQLKISDNPDNIISMETNKKKEYKENEKKKDESEGWEIEEVKYGEVRDKPNAGERLIIKDENGKDYYARWRRTDSRMIFDLNTYPSFFANMGCDIRDSNEYKKITFAKNPFDMTILTKHSALYNFFKDISKEYLSSFFLNTNFGTRQSKGFGSFYIDESEQIYKDPYSAYYFKIPITENEGYDDRFYSLFEKIEVFTKSLRAGINVKRGKKTVFYFKSLAFMYCKDVLRSEWDKKRVKRSFYFSDTKSRRDSLERQRRQHHNDDFHDILFFDSNGGYDIRDLLGFSTNEKWDSYNDSIKKKVALLKNGKYVYPRENDELPVDRMRSPLLIKPICHIDADNKISYNIHLIFQDEKVGMCEIKRQKKICFYSNKEKDEGGYRKRFMLELPQLFSMSSYFDYIFNILRLDVSKYVEEEYHQHNYYEILKTIYEELKKNYS